MYRNISKLKSNKPGKIRTTFKQVNTFEKLPHYISNNTKPSHIVQIHRNIDPFEKYEHCSEISKCCQEGRLLMSP